MEIYLDNAATTACYPEVAEAVAQAMLTDYGNPSSLHTKGIQAETLVREATAKLARCLKCKEKEIFYTSGGTESDNWALLGAARAHARSGKHIITTPIEHPAVALAMEELKEEGFEITKLPVDHRGLVTAAQVAEAMRADTILISVMMVNNEIGTIEPVAEIGAAIHKKKPDVLFHVDAVQAFGKIPVLPAKMQIDLLSVSGHKIHGPKGIGLLYIKEGTKIRPLLFGGGQQKGLRSGTDNVPGIIGLSVAAEHCLEHLEESRQVMRSCKAGFREALAGLEDVRFLSPDEEAVCAAHILNVAFPGIRSEVLLHALEEKGIYVSSGSACSSHKRAPSAVLTAIGCSKEEMESAIRFSFSEWTTQEEIEYTAQTLRELVPQLRRFVRK